MPAVRGEAVLRFIRKLAIREQTARLPDCELLERFINTRDEDAFRALVRRHGPMVLRVCTQVLENEHDAEDAFQATFLVLSRKASSVKKQDSVGNWLFGVASHAAAKLKRNLVRRRSHESQAGQPKVTDPLTALTLREAQMILNEELVRLPEKYRAPLVLCSLEGLTRDEAAQQLGMPFGKLKDRLEQARKRLRVRLASRGLTLSGAFVASVFSEQMASAAIPAGLLNSTVRAATSVAAGCAAASVVSAKVVALTEGVLRTMFVTKICTASVALVPVVTLGLLTGGLGYGTQPADNPTGKPASAPALLVVKADDQRDSGWAKRTRQKDAPDVELIRKASIDVRGIPPTKEEVEKFVKDNNPAKRDKLIDTWLGEPAYLDRMAKSWVLGGPVKDHVNARLAVLDGMAVLKKLESVRDPKRQLQALDEIEKAVRELKQRIQQPKEGKSNGAGQPDEEAGKNLQDEWRKPALEPASHFAKEASVAYAAFSAQTAEDSASLRRRGLARPEDDSLKNTLWALEERRSEALAKGDWQTQQKFLADDFIGVSARAARSDKSAIIEGAKHLRCVDWKTRDVEVRRVSKDVAILTYIYGCKEFSPEGDLIRTLRDHRATLVWALRNGGWVIVFCQETVLPGGE